MLVLIAGSVIRAGVVCERNDFWAGRVEQFSALTLYLHVVLCITQRSASRFPRRIPPELRRAS